MGRLKPEEKKKKPGLAGALKSATSLVDSFMKATTPKAPKAPLSVSIDDTEEADEFLKRKVRW